MSPSWKLARDGLTRTCARRLAPRTAGECERGASGQWPTRPATRRRGVARRGLSVGRAKADQWPRVS